MLFTRILLALSAHISPYCWLRFVMFCFFKTTRFIYIYLYIFYWYFVLAKRRATHSETLIFHVCRFSSHIVYYLCLSQYDTISTYHYCKINHRNRTMVVDGWRALSLYAHNNSNPLSILCVWKCYLPIPFTYLFSAQKNNGCFILILCVNLLMVWNTSLGFYRFLQRSNFGN